ncbi:GNAT family N-acetyltransferase [Natrialba sp. SSL1]|uniref:GNAT family N-acetyltransferase n=1 Tax=Natrialba sp. SSL1 TaxID=1869245 RepID=UPI0008F94106|nr:GNAT family N-acetyltransferase [Natrialba sp. SSL1]OIB57001.1 acetyltransferase [Natrialba sp. SSL1]
MPQDLTYELLGWPPDGPKLPLDHERFSYAGKFVMTNTGKAVARDGETIVAAIAFNEDRTDEHTLWLRYVTVARDRRGEGVGPELVSLVRDRAVERGYDCIRIAVNNPFAYEALYRAGFTYTGETTGIAELVLEYQPPTASENDPTGTEREPDAYQNGLDEFRDRDLSGDETEFLESRVGSEPPAR